MNSEYLVKLELFEGPLDLLLYLVSKAEVEIANISVGQITGQYLEYLDLMRELNIEIAADYLHMAATLIRIKAREILPPDQNAPNEGEEGEIYNREQLIAQLLEYKKFKEAAGSLRTYEAERIGSYSRGAPDQPEAASDQDAEATIGTVSLFDLLSAFREILKRAETQKFEHVVKFPMARVDDRIERILGLLGDRDEISFEELFADDMRRIVIVVTFLAMLELVKMQQVILRQEERFGRIMVAKAPPSSADQEVSSGEEPGLSPDSEGLAQPS